MQNVGQVPSGDASLTLEVGVGAGEMQSIQQVATAMTSAVDDVADQLEIQTRKAAEEGSHVTLLSDTTECELGRQLPSRFARRVKALSGPTFNVTFSAGAVFTIAAILTILPACLLRSDLLGLIGIIAACLAAVVMSTAAFAICIQKGCGYCCLMWLVCFPLYGALGASLFVAKLKNPVLDGWTGFTAPIYNKFFEDRIILSSLVGPFDSRVKASWLRAEEIYQEARPRVEAAAATFALHPYFANASKDLTEWDVTYYDVVARRLGGMWRLLQTHQRRDFVIEKDKCAMYRFFERNRLPSLPMLGVWTDKSEFLAAAKDGSAFAKATKWPLFVKFCHLTQGSAYSVRLIKSRQWVVDNWDEFELFVHEKWAYRPDDLTRPWRWMSNALTDVVPPGVMLQGPAELTFSPVVNKSVAVELKVETYWGQAYVANLIDGTDKNTLVFMRQDGTVQLDYYDTYLDELVARGIDPPPTHWQHWLRQDPRYVRCAWELAEKAARAIGADQVRIDVFISKASPDGCLINEDSLSSGQRYMHHGAFMAKLWREPHLKGWAHVASPQLEPVHKIVRAELKQGGSSQKGGGRRDGAGAAGTARSRQHPRGGGRSGGRLKEISGRPQERLRQS